MDTMKRAMQKADVLTEALPYIQDFKGSVVLVKVGGSVMEVMENLERLLVDIAFMQAVGIKPVLVHGGGKAISRAFEREKIATEFVMGLRVTTRAAVRVVEQVLKQEVNAAVVKLLRKHKARAQPLHGDWIVQAVRKQGHDPESNAMVDWGYVGEPCGVDTLTLMEMIDANIIPVVTPLGVDDEHNIYNINADTVAAALARALKVRKLAFISDVPGLLMDINNPGSLLKTLRVSSIGKLKESGVISGGMLPKLESCVEVIRTGVGKVHLVDGRMPHSLLLEIFTKQGVGTEIIADEQE